MSITCTFPYLQVGTWWARQHPDHRRCVGRPFAVRTYRQAYSSLQPSRECTPTTSSVTINLLVARGNASKSPFWYWTCTRESTSKWLYIYLIITLASTRTVGPTLIWFCHIWISRPYGTGNSSTCSNLCGACNKLWDLPCACQRQITGGLVCCIYWKYVGL